MIKKDILWEILGEMGLEKVERLNTRVVLCGFSPHQQLVAPSATSSRQEDLDVKPEAVLLREGPAASSSNLPAGGVPTKKKPTAPPPWRDSDRRPTDTRRFNYLDNLEPAGHPVKT